MPLLPTCTDIAAAFMLLRKFSQLAAKSKTISGARSFIDQQLKALKILLTAG